MADVFVSYVSEDRAIAQKIVQGLLAAGLSVWWDRHIHGGEDFAKEIERQLNAARVVVVLWSASSVDSKWVRDEAQQARDENKLIPVRSDRVLPPLGFRQAQTLDFEGWNGEVTAHAFTDLVDSVRHLFGSSVAGGPVGATPRAEPARATAGPRAKLNKSIAVLPFVDMSERKDQEFLADGMAEEILNLLAKVPDLLVPARTSSFYFKHKATKIPDIARELGVAHVLEGSIRRSGDHLRVAAQLVRADNGYHLWSETYDRELRDVFAVQDEIANAVVQALQIKLMGGELSREKGGTVNLQAYLLYLRAMSAIAQNSRSSLDAASDYFEQAIALDASYGRAWMGLGTGTLVKAALGFLNASEGYERVRQLVLHAMQLSPDLAGAHATLVWVLMVLDRNWAAAETEVQQALAIDPTNSRALLAAGSLSRTLGRWDDAERHLSVALARDPLNTRVIADLGRVYYLAGRFADAESMLTKLLQLAPSFLGGRSTLAKTLLALGRPEAALATVRQEKDDSFRLLLLPMVLCANDRKAAADEALVTLVARWADTGAYCVAMNYAYRGERELALQWLERAYEQKDPDLLEIVGEHLFEAIANDARYKALLHKMNLPD